MAQKPQQPIRRRRRKKRRLSRLLRPVKYLFALAAVLVGIGVFFKISNIQVEGNVIYSVEDVINASGIQTGKSLVFTERKTAEKRIYASLPYVDNVEIHIRAPDTIVISIGESKAAASIAYNGGYIIINQKCKVLEISDQATKLVITGFQPLEPTPGLTLGAADADSVRLSYLEELLTLLDEKGMISDVTNMDISNVADLVFLYQNRITVKLGGYDKVEYKLEFMSGILGKIEPNAKGTVYFSTDKEGHYIPE